MSETTPSAEAMAMAQDLVPPPGLTIGLTDIARALDAALARGRDEAMFAAHHIERELRARLEREVPAARAEGYIAGEAAGRREERAAIVADLREMAAEMTAARESLATQERDIAAAGPAERLQREAGWGLPTRHLRAALAAIDALTAKRDEARATVNDCMAAVPVTTVAFASDVPVYIRACFDAMAADRDALARRLSVVAVAGVLDGASDEARRQCPNRGPQRLCNCANHNAAPILAAEVNALPGRVRRYVHDLETRCDPTGDIQSIASLTEQRDALLAARVDLIDDRDALAARVRELEATLANERGEGEPPSEGWFWHALGDGVGAWNHRDYDGVVARVHGTRHSGHFYACWQLACVDGARREHRTARAAMLAADAALRRRGVGR